MDLLPTLRQPNFNNLLAVLQRKKPSRPTLFEFFLNDRLHSRLCGQAIENDPLDPLAYQLQRLKAFRNAGYDYLTVLLPDFNFPYGHFDQQKSISQNQGAMITDRASLERYIWPDVDALDYTFLDRLAQHLPQGMKLIIYTPNGILENAIYMVGYERLCMMTLDDPGLTSDIFANIGERLLRFYQIAGYHPAVGACICNDDWGFRTQTVFSPRDMRKFVFPWHKKFVEAIHEAGKPAILHSCGHFERVIDDITNDMHFDARHSYEDNILPVEEAYERYYDRIAILGGIDVDFICRSTPEQVYQRSRKMLERTADRGGYALGTGNSVPDYVPDDGYFAMIRAALE